ncbi:uracil-DNA glycosylase [Microvirga flavescens]|uniref:uracil-DNA glycosylase n=1 Tax=Microvirga flavescens TaxID=2249811 RepID=UPI000DD8AFB1|nr:uracil-DNA glycosylase [Microvirga flavescens]
MKGLAGQALAAFRDDPRSVGWRKLPFFNGHAADAVAERVDERIAAGASVLPPAGEIFNALITTPLDEVKVVILGQDPYPTPGDAHGLAFSYHGKRRLPASLKTILAEMAEETGTSVPKSGDLTPWAKQGVLLLNTALTVEAGKAGAHLKFGWSALTDNAVSAISKERPAVVFLLWGGPARKRAELIDRTKHLVIECGHPSPLNRLRDFRGTRPFTRTNEWLVSKGMPPIDWRLD